MRSRLIEWLKRDYGGSIGRMRRKMHLTAIVATALVLTVVVAALDLVVWNNVLVQVDTVVDLIEAKGGVLSADAGITDDDLDANQGFNTRLNDVALEEIPYNARYFTVTFNDGSEIVDANMGSIASVDTDAAEAMANEVIASGQMEGFDGVYRYRVVPMGDGTMIIFYFAYDDLFYFDSFRYASIMMGLLGLVIFALLEIPLILWVTRPLEEAQERQRRFVTDASHELRTPISVITSAMDVIEIESGESEWTRSVHHQAKRLEDLTDKLVALAKVEEGERSLSLGDVDVSTVAMGFAEDFEAVAQSKGKSFSFAIQPNVVAYADTAMMEQALSILLDNAFRHSPDFARVELSVSSASGLASIAVTNDVAGMAEGPHPELFDRFYKSDGARSYAGGHGIGLSVVRGIARAHGGRVSATCVGGRLTVELVV